MKRVKIKNFYVLFLLILLLTLLFLGIGHFTFLDSEWQDWRVLGQIKKDSRILDSYKNTYSRYPNNLEEAKIKDQYCIWLALKCFKIRYKPADDKQSYTIAAEANSPFVVYFKNNTEYGIAFEENYQGSRSDLPIYRENKNIFNDPEEWFEL